jgi:hypothetical protein
MARLMLRSTLSSGEGKGVKFILKDEFFIQDLM